MKSIKNIEHKRYYFYRYRSGINKIEYYTAWSDDWTEDFLHAHFTADIELVRSRARGWSRLLQSDSPGMNWNVAIGAVEIIDDGDFRPEIVV